MITILSQDVLLKIFLKFKYDEILKVFFNDDMKFVLMCNEAIGFPKQRVRHGVYSNPFLS
jgi:hypothetical protein